MILLIDNYDSFVYNLARYLVELGQDTRVIRNDATTLAGVRQLAPRAIVLSPGPGTPEQAGLCIPLIQALWQEVPILGVCLGHQAIAAAFGGRVIRAPEPVHGRTSSVLHNHLQLFRNLPSPLRVTRYHSLIIDELTLPTELQITARTRHGIPMAICHRVRPVFGVQFHPESVLSEHGHALLSNFLHLAGLTTPGMPAGDLLAIAEEPPILPSPLHW